MTFNPQRAEALRSAILGTAQSLRHSPEGDVRTLLTEHLALLQEAELIYLTDAFVGEGEEQIGAESERVLPDPDEFAARTEKFARDNCLRGDPHADNVVVQSEPEWVVWRGGEMPLAPGRAIAVQHRSLEAFHTYAGGAYASRWTHEGIESDIVAYKVVK